MEKKIYYEKRDWYILLKDNIIGDDILSIDESPIEIQNFAKLFKNHEPCLVCTMKGDGIRITDNKKTLEKKVIIDNLKKAFVFKLVQDQGFDFKRNLKDSCFSVEEDLRKKYKIEIKLPSYSRFKTKSDTIDFLINLQKIIGECVGKLQK